MTGQDVGRIAREARERLDVIELQARRGADAQAILRQAADHLGVDYDADTDVHTMAMLVTGAVLRLLRP